MWRTQDERIQSAQMVTVDADRNRVFREGFDVTTSKYVTLSDSGMRELDLPITGHWAVGRDPRLYISDYKRPAADFYRVNTLTGERTRMLTGQLTRGHSAPEFPPDGKSFLYWKDKPTGRSYDLDAGTSHTARITGGGVIPRQGRRSSGAEAALWRASDTRAMAAESLSIIALRPLVPAATTAARRGT